MITMSTDAEPLNIVALGKKIVKVNAVLPRHMQWAIYKGALIVSDVIMTGFAFRLAYFLRFETPFGFFAQDALISIEHYRLLIVLVNFPFGI